MISMKSSASVLSCVKKIGIISVAIAALFTLAGCSTQAIGMLNPKGIITFEERKLFFDTLALMLIVVLPVIVMSFVFVYHYRSNHTKDYKPNWSHSYLLESLWWGIPCVIIGILAVLTWNRTHELDPYKPLQGYAEKPLVVQVIALPWKWLFIYPEQQIASVNQLVIPAGQPVEYWLTTDNVPMSAFFIPQIGSQLYAMAGMKTRLNLVANEAGHYEGLNALYNGDGFTDMHFAVEALSPDEFKQWVKTTESSKNHLTSSEYLELVRPSTPKDPLFYSHIQPNLFNDVVMLYMSSTGVNHPRYQFGNVNGLVQLEKE